MKRVKSYRGKTQRTAKHIAVQPVVKVVNDREADDSPRYGEVVRTGSQGKKFGAFDLGNAMKSAGLPKRIKYTLDNSGDTVNTKDFVIFDPIGLVSSVKSWSRTAATPSALTATILNDYFQKGQVEFSQIRAEATSSSSQFQNELLYVMADLDGKIKLEEPLYVEDGVSGDQYNSKIQNYVSTFIINALTGIGVTVNKGEKLYLTFYLKADYTRF